MKVIAKKFGEDEVEYVKLTYDEELSMAKWVMETLCLPWIETRDDFYIMLKRIYFRKCKGKDFEAWHLVDLFQKYQHYNQYEDLELPLIPVFKEDGTFLIPEQGVGFATKDITRAWREAWEMTPEFSKKVDFGEVFPDGTVISGYEEEQNKIERAFWERVAEVRKEYDCSEKQAIVEVSDYMPRGKL